jgi:hypothetical protein
MPVPPPKLAAARLAAPGLLAPAILTSLILASAPVLARDCRPWDMPPGVRMPDRPGCPATRPPEARPKPGREPGFVDLGNGTEIRINGRVRAEGRFDR